MSQKTAIVTGASRGLGASIARDLAAHGFRVLISARTEQDLQGVAKEIRDADGHCEIVPADLSRPEECERLLTIAQEMLGTIDVLVNNAGIGIYGPVEEVTEADLDRLMAINVKGVIFCSKAGYLLMKGAGHGHIINVASIAGKIGLPGESLYCASKFAVVGFTEALAAEAKAHGVKVTAFCPGGIDTPFWDPVSHNKPDVSTFLQPDDVARMVTSIALTPASFGVPEIILRPMQDRH